MCGPVSTEGDCGRESGNESGHCLEMQAGTQRDGDKDRETDGEEKKAPVSSSTCCTHRGTRCGTLHLINQTLIRPDLGSHNKTALNLRGKKKKKRRKKRNTINRHIVIACEGGSCYSPHKHFLRELKFGLEERLIWGEESVPAKSKLVEFNEFCVSAGESARATLITLCNELRSGEHRRKTKARRSPTASGRQNKRAAHTHI